MPENNDNNMDFNFGGGDIFGGFSPDLSSLQKPKEEEKVEETVVEETVKEDEPVDQPVIETDEPTEEVEQPEPSDEPTDDTDDTDYADVSYTAIANYLSENGILDAADDYEGEDTAEALEHAVRKTVMNSVQHYKDSIPEQGKHFLEYLEQGGDINKYFNVLEKSIDFSNLDISTESNQKKVYTEYLKSIGTSPEDIEIELQEAEDNLLLESKATRSKKALEAKYAKEQEALVEQQKLQVQEQQKQYQQYISQIESTIDSSNDLAGLSVTPSERAEFKKYLLGRDQEGLTPYERELQEDPVKTQLELAYLKFKKYDFSKITNKVKTQETKRIREILKNTNKDNGRSPQVQQAKEQGHLGAFKSLI